MSEFKKYKRKAIAEMRPYIEGDYNLVTCNKCNQVTRWLDLGIIWTSIED